MGIGGQDNTAFEFEGRWQDFLPIGITNALLNIVTLGFYRFWATTRERRYLWSKTRFIDDQLEWAGTGKELFIGFLAALVIFFTPLIALQFLVQALILQGQEFLAGLLGLGFYFLIFYLTGLAIFRGLRYRLSRTSWHGIHGGSDDRGFRYGLSYFWKTIAGALAAGLLIPWSMANLWSERWNRMSFGPHMFESGPDWQKLMKRYALCYLVPIGAIILAGIAAVAIGATDGMAGGMASAGIVIASFYIVLPLMALAYYASFFREMIGTLSLSTLDFEFTARTKSWFMLFLGNLGLWLLALVPGALIITSFGLFSGFANIQPGQNPMLENPVNSILILAAILIPFMLVGPFIRYRSWRFFIRHLEASGEVNLLTLTQSQTADLKQGEGLLDAFDMGAI
ncbi:MAG: YjgN family protein [Pseudomonadota bacterium]